MRYSITEKVDETIAKHVDDIMSANEDNWLKYDKDENACWTVNLPVDDMQVDFVAWAPDRHCFSFEDANPWCEAVVYDKDGNEIGSIDCINEVFFGKWEFEITSDNGETNEFEIILTR